jgi:hypothetical protein
VVQASEALADIADKFNVHEQTIMQENNLRPGSRVQPGEVLFIPMAPLGPLLHWGLQLIGLAGTLTGVFVSLWLLGRSELLPTGTNVPVIGVSAATAIVHYVVVQVNSSEAPGVITPLFVLSSVRDGFAWSTVLILLARVLRFGRTST